MFRIYGLGCGAQGNPRRERTRETWVALSWCPFSTDRDDFGQQVHVEIDTLKGAISFRAPALESSAATLKSQKSKARNRQREETERGTLNPQSPKP